MAEFFSMGGYGTYVWTSYGLTAVVLVVLLVVSLKSLKSTETTFDRLRAAVGPKEMKRMETANGDEA
ncbi:heme exporter protein CcmD [Magnetovibrio blakemorei]|uniref:Heme exporter protein D n=1 Tax=Magnetovibrio blakemorei TaxID=28181 RepID=A0A1E5QC86_9PROT|nr:heme exporter protein CcmD [Magnetovibrio blakemorei]OEJ69684.1 heme exporter protein CcmD [Magnetovibrio blakemorei]